MLELSRYRAMHQRLNFFELNPMNVRHHSPIKPRPLLLSLMLTAATVSSLWSAPLQAYESAPLLTAQSTSSESLPRQVMRQLRRDLAQQTGASPRQFQVTRYSRETWPDGCLGLGGIAELCLAALVEGWRVELTDGAQQWSYRTNLDGTVVKQEPAQAVSELPVAVRDAVIAAAVRESGVPPTQLKIVEAQPRTFDGCWGLPPANAPACTAIALFGWQVIVSSDAQTWVYHTSDSGSEVRLNATASYASPQIKLSFMAEGDRLVVPADQVLRVQSSGGFTGMVYETTLYRDGRIVRSPIYVPFTAPPEQIGQLTPQQVEQFERDLQQYNLRHLDGLRYQVPGAADQMTMTLAYAGITVQYDDIATEQLPLSLRQFITQWQTLSRPAS